MLKLLAAGGFVFSYYLLLYFVLVLLNFCDCLAVSKLTH